MVARSEAIPHASASGGGRPLPVSILNHPASTQIYA